MSFEQKEDTGSLFKNDKRSKDNHPHATGSALIGGVEYWISAWTKEGKNGKWQSISFTRKDKSQRPPSKPPVQDESAVPF